MAGLNAMPGYNSPQQYQTLSEENLNNYGGMAGAQMGLGNQLAGLGGQMAGQWNQRANQMFGAASGIASREPSWYADRAGVTSNQAFDESKGVQDRTLSRMGINPNSGRFVGLQTQWGLARAAAESGARTRASQDAEQTQFGRQAQLLGMANQGIGQGIGAIHSAGGLYGQAGGAYNQLAGEYGGLAGDAAQYNTVNQASNTSQQQINDMLAQINGQM